MRGDYGWKAFIWQAGHMRELGTPDGWSLASAINARGDVVGRCGIHA